MDWCKYFQDAFDDPRAHPPRITIGQFYERQRHYQQCHRCHVLVDSIPDAPPGIPMSLN